MLEFEKNKFKLEIGKRDEADTRGTFESLCIWLTIFSLTQLVMDPNVDARNLSRKARRLSREQKLKIW